MQFVGSANTVDLPPLYAVTVSAENTAHLMRAVARSAFQVSTQLQAVKVVALVSRANIVLVRLVSALIVLQVDIARMVRATSATTALQVNIQLQYRQRIVVCVSIAGLENQVLVARPLAFVLPDLDALTVALRAWLVLLVLIRQVLAM